MIITHVNNYFVEWLKMYLMSIKKNDPDKRIYVSGANLSPRQVKGLQGMSENIMIVNHSITDIKIPVRQFMQFRVTRVLLEAWHSKLSDIYIATNADMFLNKSLDDLYGLIETCDIALHFTGIHQAKNMIQNGIIAFKSNLKVLRFLEYYNQTTQGSSLTRYADQRGLFRAYKKFKSELQFKSIPHDYVDGYCKEESHMWSGHLKGKWPAYQHFQRALNIPVSDKKPKWWKYSCE